MENYLVQIISLAMAPLTIPVPITLSYLQLTLKTHLTKFKVDDRMIKVLMFFVQLKPI